MKSMILWLLVAFASANVMAKNIWCNGKVTNIYIDASNNVIINGTWRNHYTRICNTEDSSEVSIVTCSLWVSLATTSLTDDLQVTLMYDDQGGTMTCANIPTYTGAPRPQYLMLLK
ncbi:hypothetical protein C3B51_05370 [Pseudoalteromonas rubra]|uniref:Uncharacterized protein n=1 Tax=Pseudoalteromonas rubra TaxID=43658 RepID=A0A4Q7ELD3_9GAMM|nr:hypothetical protein [Pseudoalteromonas rubra]RZM84080.1 hypothetical protein C3B51_05370 [Pseudoalteromonas rubra]